VAMLSGVVSGGVTGAVGHGVRQWVANRDTLWRVLRQSQIENGSVAKGAFRPDKAGQVSVLRGPGWLVKRLVGRSSAFRDVGGFARLSKAAITQSGLEVVPARDLNLGFLLGRLHENIIYPGSSTMAKGEFDRLLLSIVQSLE